ncbi:Flp pilus assembly complex ATPase component TadA [Thermogymnomonas acidicola]|uniref:ATPase, T2SS/T4P/T4SS family n=1 Tax=Thermogymnomonas acidicola TaxID=399579 RepID=UPI000946878D|nr:ATPase, T2SS/T4P/T4SS family [Thermogymnomonas acidicola]
MTPLDIIRQEGGASSDLMAYLWLLVSRGGANILVCGGTGTGKTTFLNALMSFIPENLRVITIEETREIEYPGGERAPPPRYKAGHRQGHRGGRIQSPLHSAEAQAQLHSPGRGERGGGGVLALPGHVGRALCNGHIPCGLHQHSGAQA